jgi:hypothetical protein
MKHICFSMHKSQDDPSSLDKKFHRLETIVVAAKTRPPNRLLLPLTRRDHWYLASGHHVRVNDHQPRPQDQAAKTAVLVTVVVSRKQNSFHPCRSREQDDQFERDEQRAREESCYETRLKARFDTGIETELEIQSD